MVEHYFYLSMYSVNSISNKREPISDIYKAIAKNLPNYVYFITDGTNIKIGKTQNVKDRLHHLQTGCVEKLRIVRVFKCLNKYESGIMEKAFHIFFNNYKISNEWYNYSVLKTIEKLSDEEVFDLIGYKIS